jgi:CheY-like chemotaxis protein
MMSSQFDLSADAETLPADFLFAVRTALMHLYDNAFLQNHPLAASGDRLTRAQDLRRLLLDCIERLRPQPIAHGDAARAYAVLTYRCVDGLTIEEIEEKLGLSRRQTYREHTKGVEAVARQLWDQLPVRPPPGRQPSTGETLPSNDTPSRQALAAAELERLGKEARREPVSLPEVLDGVCQLLAARFQQRGIRLTQTAPDTLPPVVADRTLLRQALINLLSHAVDTVCGPRELLMAAQESGKSLFLSMALVSAAESKGETPTPVPREGVALAVAQSLIAAQGGELSFHQSDDAWQATIELATAHPPTILIIDDNQDLVELFRRYLAGHRLHIVGVNSGHEALALLPQLAPQLILLDVMMPQQDGWEVLQSLNEWGNAVTAPVVVCSVLREHELALSLGASDTLVKPVNQPALLDLLRRWLGPLHPSV